MPCFLLVLKRQEILHRSPESWGQLFSKSFSCRHCCSEELGSTRGCSGALVDKARQKAEEMPRFQQKQLGSASTGFKLPALSSAIKLVPHEHGGHLGLSPEMVSWLWVTREMPQASG